MRIILEEDDIIAAVREHLSRQGFELEEGANLVLDQDPSTARFYLNVDGVRPGRPVPVYTPPVVNTAPLPVQGESPRVAPTTPAIPTRKAIDPGPPPEPEDDTPLEALLSQSDEFDKAKRKGGTAPNPKFKSVQTYSFDDMGKDPSDMSDEL